MLEQFQQIFQKKVPHKVSKLKSFMSSCLVLIQDKDAITELQAPIEETPEESHSERRVNQVKKKFKTRRELRMTAQIGDYDMDYIILDLGSDVNILTGQHWESMGNPCLDWSPIQLRLANQEKVLLIGRLSQVPIDIEGLCTFADFEVINIVDDTDPYHALLKIDWAIDNQTIIIISRK